MRSFFTAYKRFDPAARSLLEIVLLYPGVKAVALHRIAHFLYQRKVSFGPRLISEIGRLFTGIEIHPGAELGLNVIIEHGSGTVIGETSVVEDEVVILHGVTLGSRDIRNPGKGKRHPTIKRGATLCTGATILGDVIVGEGATVGANAVVLQDVPPGAVAVGAPARIVVDSPKGV